MSRTIFIKHRRFDAIVDTAFNYGILALALVLCWFVLY
jgi:hypothetical protein